VLQEEDNDAYMLEASHLQLDKDLPPAEIDGKAVRVDHWWAKLFPRYPTLGKVVKACLSIFTGPHIEQSFSQMYDIINSKTNRLDISTYSAMQSIRYDLAAKCTTSEKLYHRADILRTPVNQSLVYHMNTSAGRYKKRLQSTRTETEQKRKRLKLAKPSSSTEAADKPVGSKSRTQALHQAANKIKQRVHGHGLNRNK
jgi:hypothetical protein